MKYAFEVKTLVMVEAESEEEAWDLLPETARNAVDDFDYERSPEDDKDPNKKYKYNVVLVSRRGTTELLETFYTEEEANQYDESRKRRMSLFGELRILKEEIL